MCNGCGAGIADLMMRETLDSFNAFHPIGCIGQVADVAAVIERLPSDEFGWVTGAVWDVDGGVMARRY